MSQTNRKKFEATALASELVTQRDLDQALDSLRAEEAHAAQESDRFTSEQLAAKLVEFGKINFWQAEKLFEGKKDFRLGPYRILDSVGRGGMGEVFKAEHNVMRRVVAVKVLPPHKMTPDSIANFLREIQLLAQLDDENLVRAFDAGEHKGVHYLVTEFVPGSDLRKIVRRNGPMSMRQAASVVSQAARGLDHAHRRGLIHRDIKPGNLLVTPEGKCKVSDLGLAGYFNDEEDERTEVKKTKIVGTADYLAPELILNPEKLTPASDIYALGCTLYYAVTGKVPFTGGNTSDKARAHLTMHPLDPRRLNPRLEDDFVDVIAAMMVKDPAERVGTALEVSQRLERWASQPGSDELEIETHGSHSTQFTTGRPVGGGDGDIGDTRPILEDAVYADLLVDDPSSASQISQPTWPVVAMHEETAPLFGAPPAYDMYGQTGGGGGLSRGMMIFIVIGLGTALGVLAAMLILMLVT